MTTIEAIRILLPAFIGIWISAAWSAWRSPSRYRAGREYYAGMMTMWLVFTLLVLVVAEVWSRMQA